MTHFEKFKIVSVLILGIGINITAAMLLDRFFADQPVMMFMTLIILFALAVISIVDYLYSYIAEQDNYEESLHIAYQSNH